MQEVNITPEGKIKVTINNISREYNQVEGRTQQDYINMFYRDTDLTYIKEGSTIKVSERLKENLKTKTQQIEEKKTIKENINTGITAITIKDINNTDEQIIKNKIKELLSPLIQDTELLNLLTLEENLRKIQTRFEYKFTLEGENRKIGELLHIGSKTPREAINEIKNELRKGMSFEEMYNSLKTLTQRGFAYKEEAKDKLKTTNLTITFRKGK